VANAGVAVARSLSISISLDERVSLAQYLRLSFAHLALEWA